MNTTRTKPKDARDLLMFHGRDALRAAAMNTTSFDPGTMAIAGVNSSKPEFMYLRPSDRPVPDAGTIVEVEDPPAAPLPPPAPFIPCTSACTPRSEPTSAESGEDDGDDDLDCFPMHCLPGAAGTMAREIARVTTSRNEPLAAAAVLGVLSASLGAGISLNSGGDRWTRPNLFIMPVAESGTGKGEAFSLAAAPIEDMERELIEDFDLNLRPGLIARMTVAEARSKKLCREAARIDDLAEREVKLREYQIAEQERSELERCIDAAPRLKVEDTTKEALAILMRNQPGEALASLSSEARGIFSIVKGRYGKSGGDEDFYCKAYSGDAATVDRVGRPSVLLRRPCLTALWMVQPDAARDALNESALTESGLIPRFLMFDAEAEPKERHGPPPAIPHEVKHGWATLIRSLSETYREEGEKPKTIKVSPEAVAVLEQFENENIRHRQRNGAFRDMRSYAARWSENAWKIAIVLHAAKHGDKAHEAELDAATAGDAVEMMRWFVSRQLALLAAGRHDKMRGRVSELLAVLADAGGEITMRDLRRSHGFDQPEVEQLQSRFHACFKIVTRKPSTGRPSLVVSNRVEDMRA